jgi:hypothetical protein
MTRLLSTQVINLCHLQHVSGNMGKDNCIYMHEGRSFALQFILYNVTLTVIMLRTNKVSQYKIVEKGEVVFIFLHKYAVFVISLKIQTYLSSYFFEDIDESNNLIGVVVLHVSDGFLNYFFFKLYTF